MTTDVTPTAPRALQLESFHQGHQDVLLTTFLLEAGREALGLHHSSPVPMYISGDAVQDHTRTLHFGRPDPRTKATVQRERVVEDGAIVMAGLALSLERLRLLRVTRRGSRVDYFFAAPGSTERQGVLEVSGTDHGSIAARCREKLEQARQSLWVRPPFCMPGLVAVTRFADPECRVERVDPEAKK
jgi:hypothetical protein